MRAAEWKQLSPSPIRIYFTECTARYREHVQNSRAPLSNCVNYKVQMGHAGADLQIKTKWVFSSH